ncbi:MAG: Flp pilus assembly protein CpaB [Bryobacteraceae bacterium]|nr:Flp pilus assembly protein CpaB [Bryobacteraceae bacterium]
MDRQKIIMIFAGAWVSAALLTWFVFSRATSANTEKMVEVYAASADLPAGTRVKKSDLKKVRVPEKDAPKMAILNETAIIDRVLLMSVSSGETFVVGKTASSTGAEGVSSLIQPGLRAMSIPVTDSTAAGGLIQPRSRVDVLFTRTGSMREAITATIAQDVQVMSIGRVTEVNTLGPDGKPITAPTTAAGTQTRAAVLLVTPEQASKIELAKNQGKVSLVLRNPLDKAAVETASATAESLDPDIFAGTARALRANSKVGRPPLNVRDDKQWASLTGNVGADGQPLPPPVAAKTEKKDPPKPKFVVDVYHGDKHVQELFQ